MYTAAPRDVQFLCGSIGEIPWRTVQQGMFRATTRSLSRRDSSPAKLVFMRSTLAPRCKVELASVGDFVVLPQLTPQFVQKLADLPGYASKVFFNSRIMPLTSTSPTLSLPCSTSHRYGASTCFLFGRMTGLRRKQNLIGHGLESILIRRTSPRRSSRRSSITHSGHEIEWLIYLATWTSVNNSE